MDDVGAVLSVLKEAIGIEMDGHRFYSQCAAGSKDEAQRRVFLSVIKDEEEHLRILRAEYGRLSSGQEWLELKEARAATPGLSSLRLFPDSAPGTFKEPRSDLEALELAMDFERKGHQMYAAEAAKAANLAVQAVFRYLAEAEDRHYQYLEKHRNYLESNGAWSFFELERPMFEG